MIVLSIIFRIISKLVKLIANIFVHIIVWTGLWVPVLFTGVFFLTMFSVGAKWAEIGGWYYVGMAFSILFGIMWFIRFTLKIGKNANKGKQ